METHTNHAQTQDSASNPSYNDSALAAKKQKFLSAYQLGATIAESARFAGVTPRTPYNWRSGDPQFAQAWRDARQKFVEDLEAEAFKRAIQGNDRMLMFLLKYYKPDPASERQQPKGMTIADLAGLAEKVSTWT